MASDALKGFLEQSRAKGTVTFQPDVDDRVAGFLLSIRHHIQARLKQFEALSPELLRDRNVQRHIESVLWDEIKKHRPQDLPHFELSLSQSRWD
jgi:hypothetical protein